MTFLQFKQHQASLELRMKIASTSMKAFEHLRAPNGLYPDSVKILREWRQAKVMYDLAFTQSRSFNGKWAKVFEKEAKAEIAAKREAALQETT